MQKNFVYSEVWATWKLEVKDFRKKLNMYVVYWFLIHLNNFKPEKKILKLCTEILYSIW